MYNMKKTGTYSPSNSLSNPADDPKVAYHGTMEAKLINHQKLNRTFFELPAGLIWTRLLLAGVVIAIRFCSTISRNVRLPLFLGRLLSVLATSLSESATGAGFLRIFSGLTNTDSSSSSSRLV